MDELTWMPAWEMRDLMAKGDLSPVEVVDHFLARIEQLDPTLHAFAHLDAAGAREQAASAERAVSSGEPVGPLHGIPISVKEHIAVKGLRVRSFIPGRSASPSTTTSASSGCAERARSSSARTR